MDASADIEWNALLIPAHSDTSLGSEAAIEELEPSSVFESPTTQNSGQSTPADLDHASKLEYELNKLASRGGADGDTAIVDPSPRNGVRFSKEVVRLLRNWLQAHMHQPYPTVDEMNALQQQTGLNKTQISNWFANARRRRKLPKSRSMSRSMEIPLRPDTPAPFQNSQSMNPLERWRSSPPEHEPASATAIARAIERNDGFTLQQENFHDHNFWEDRGRSRYNASSASSVGTSNSSDFATSTGSSTPSRIARPHYKRRRNRYRHTMGTPLLNSFSTYQCTFCTETFKTKHDWQRHEKSLHLPLERWVCALQGPRTTKSESMTQCCVFCTADEPDDAHIDSHNYSACATRSVEERTFNRKDHLHQHLQLFHDIKSVQWTMDSWRIPMPDVQSRCGFCALEMTTWGERIDHLAAHFKSGKTMADWQGDWGFNSDTLKLLENAIPPYIIDYERSTPAPFSASSNPHGTPPTAYELIKVELEHSLQNHFESTGKMLDNSRMQLEACRIIFASEVASILPDNEPSSSWLRDLIMSCEQITMQAKFGPLRLRDESRFAIPRINGQDNLFSMCPLEAELLDFVATALRTGLAVSDEKLQEQASKIVGRMEKRSMLPSDAFANWLVKLIYGNTDWLLEFKNRVSTMSLEDSPFVQTPVPTLAFETSAAYDSGSVLRHFYSGTEGTPCDNDLVSSLGSLTIPPLQARSTFTQTRNDRSIPAQPRMLANSANFFSWMIRDLARWVAATMSPNNPNCHIPTDAELQHQARCIVYDDDDPWNETAADNIQWLQQFKREVGIPTEPPKPNEEGPAIWNLYL